MINKKGLYFVLNYNRYLRSENGDSTYIYICITTQNFATDSIFEGNKLIEKHSIIFLHVSVLAIKVVKKVKK